MQTDPHALDNDIYTVSRLNNEVRLLLEECLPFVMVEGEISNFAAPHSGHWYFSLKDAAAQVRCAMFRGHQRQLGFIPKDGMHVLIKARVSLYENRGEFQLIAEYMEERGLGKLQRAFELLKKKCEAAGLFEITHKKPLPVFPQQLGVITSATGAAIKDILHVLKRRYPCLPVIIYPTLVQGQAATAQIVAAIHTANRRRECDVLILARGGGSLEDLWCFNEESVAHAIYHSDIPIISGIGHEIDFTIADFVADKRAPTPSAAAEIATPDKTDWLQRLQHYQQQMTRRIQHQCLNWQQQLDHRQKQLFQQHPKRRLKEQRQHLEFCELTLVQLQTRLLTQLQIKLHNLHSQLQHFTPAQHLATRKHQLQRLQQQLQNGILTHLTTQKTKLGNAAATLHALSPLATLERGYAIAETKAHHILRNASEVKPGDEITVKLAVGKIECLVEKST